MHRHTRSVGEGVILDSSNRGQSAYTHLAGSPSAGPCIGMHSLQAAPDGHISHEHLVLACVDAAHLGVGPAGVRFLGDGTQLEQVSNQTAV